MGTSVLVGAAGAVLRFEAAAQAAGFKVHAIGVILIIGGIIGVVTSVMNWNTWGAFNRGHAARSGDTVLIDASPSRSPSKPRDHSLALGATIRS